MLFRAIILLLIVLTGCAHQAESKTPPTAGHDPILKASVAELTRHINDNPDILHGERTPAVTKLIAIGRPSLKYGALELLLSDDESTRIRAWTVLEDIVSTELGYCDFKKSPEERHKAGDKFRQLLDTNGLYERDDVSEGARRASYEKWKRWLGATDPPRSPE